jgi:hypothetical protein
MAGVNPVHFQGIGCGHHDVPEDKIFFDWVTKAGIEKKCLKILRTETLWNYSGIPFY